MRGEKAMMRNKRGQAALEFLTTYGWAFMIILVMIGALAYFNVLNPSGLVSDSCLLPSGFSCIDSEATEAAVNFYFVNGIGQGIEFVAANGGGIFVSTEGGGEETCALDDTTPADGQEVSVTCSAPGGMGSAGDKAKIAVRIAYEKSNGHFLQEVTGSITATIK